MNQQQHTGSERSAGSPGERTRAVGRPARAPRDQEAPYSATDEGSQDRCTGRAHRMLGAIAPRCQTSASGGRPARRRRRAAGPCGAAWRLSPASRPARQQGARLGGGAGRARAHTAARRQAREDNRARTLMLLLIFRLRLSASAPCWPMCAKLSMANPAIFRCLES